MRGVDAEGLDAVLKFFYSGTCNLDYTNVIQVRRGPTRAPGTR